MTKPEDIPQDVWDEALRLWQDEEADAGEVIIARAIMAATEAEREAIRVVFVAVHDGGRAGHSEPLKVFTTEALARKWVAAANTHYGGFKYLSMDLISPDDLAVPPAP